MLVAQAAAAFDGRDYMVPDDVKRAVLPVLRHRVILKPEAELGGIRRRPRVDRCDRSRAGAAAMISPSLHPRPVSAICEPRRRWSFGLTGRSIGLLTTGSLLLIPGILDWPAELLQCCCGTGWCFWPRCSTACACLTLSKLCATRTWSNAPALDSQTEIELTIENQGRTILHCRLMDDLPASAGGRSGGSPADRISTGARAAPLSRRAAGTGRLRDGMALCGLPLSPGPGRALGQGSAHPDRARLSGAAHERGTADVPGPEPANRSAVAAGAPARASDATSRACVITGKATTCATSAGRRRARRGNLITRQYQTERSQPVWIVLDCGRLMRSRVAARPRLTIGIGRGRAFRTARVHSKLDHACTAAVALAQLALYSGDRVGLLAYGQNPATAFAGTRSRSSAAADRVAGTGASRGQRG